jgi:DNA primase
LTGKSGNKFNIYASIGIPIVDSRQNVVAWCYRRTKNSPEQQARYIYTGGAKIINRTWFGLNHNQKAKHIVVVEGALDAMWCDQAGFPAIALLGSQAGSSKLAQLDRYRSVTLLCDADAAGAMAVNRIGTALADKLMVRVARYRPGVGNDPQELTPLELARAIREAIPWSDAVLHRNAYGVVSWRSR